jgi:Ca2+-binding RTX toxin-like protein
VGGDSFVTNYLGTPGDDDLLGSSGSDTFTFAPGGSDVAHGQGGGDTFSYSAPTSPTAGSAALYGEDGDDRLFVYDVVQGLMRHSLYGGAGADEFWLQTTTGTVVDAGEGDDRLYASQSTATVTLGDGLDYVELFNTGSHLTIKDFQLTGASMDRIDFYSPLAQANPAWDRVANPFALGYARLVQSHADTVVEILVNGVYTPVFTLENILASALSSWNLDGFTPTETAPARNIQGSANADQILGTAGPDVILGSGGADSLDGGGGADVVDGGDGDDYIYDDSGPGATLIGGAGADYLQLHRFDLTEPAGPIIMDGGSGNDSFEARIIAPAYDSSPVHLIGGPGDDTYVVNRQSMLIFERPGEGDDAVLTSVDFYLYANIEHLWLQDGATIGVGNAMHNGLTGSDGANVLLGGAGDDLIFGRGGDDRLFGETGDDTLHGDAGADYIVGGDGADDLNGDAGADSLYGEDGDDVLDGGLGAFTDILVGGAGADSLRGSSGEGEQDLMDGGAGDDTYLVDAANDLTFEAAGGGTDTVSAAIHGGGYYLYPYVENLTLVSDTAYGVGNELANVLVGNTFANWLLGGAGNDTLNGGAGNDVLFGEGGADTFVFQRGTGGDVIGDFAVGVDKIQLTGLVASFAEVQARMVQNGADSAIDLGQGELVVIHNVAMSAFTAGDFLF